MSVATLLAHEWLAEIGGSENVFEQLTATFPDARRVCLWNDAPHRFPAEAVDETWLARTPMRRSKAASLPFQSGAWKRVDLTSVDRVIASTHVFSHHLAGRAAERGLEAFAYVYTPARYVWAPEFDARGRSLPARIGRGAFKALDRARTSQSVRYAAVSKFISKRMADAWSVDAAVIYPPVAVKHMQSVTDWRTKIVDARELSRIDALPESFVLGASRLIEYKRLEATMEVAAALGMPCVIVGDGPDESRLRSLAERQPVPVTFFGRASTPALYALYQAASLFVFMAIEDFGIMPVEAMALQTPVVVNSRGGARESVEGAGGGCAANPDSSADLLSASTRALSMQPSREAVAAFSPENFRDAVRRWVGDA